MSDMHEITITEIKTTTRKVLVSKAMFKQAGDAIVHVSEALDNIAFDKLGEHVDFEADILVNGINTEFM